MTTGGLRFDDRSYWTVLIHGVSTLYNSLLHTFVSTVTSSLAVACQRLPTAEVSLTLGTRTLPVP
jgi:hypothetical protein